MFPKDFGKRKMVDVTVSSEVVQRIVNALETGQLPGDIVNEADFERRFVEPIVARIVEETGLNVELCVHPWGDKVKGPIWKECKSWATIDAWGMRHTLDIFIRDRESLASIAIEVKYCRAKAGRLPTGEFQRMMGQALLGRARHNDIIAVFGFEGLVADLDDHGVGAFLRDLRIWPVVRHIS